ncbi:MAG: hypothetical protein N3A38_09840, partial [Planctomycetota bacterium]|nr:hypothetical protein [Planctomycetota bacterium]
LWPFLAAFAAPLLVAAVLDRRRPGGEPPGGVGTSARSDSAPASFGAMLILPGALVGALVPAILREPAVPGLFSKLLCALLPALAVALAGMVRDRRAMSRGWALAILAAICVLFAAFCRRFEAVKLPGFDPVELRYLSVPFTALWMFAAAGAVGAIGGPSGPVGAVFACASLSAGCCASVLGDGAVSILGLAASGSMAAFLMRGAVSGAAAGSAGIFHIGEAGSRALGMFLAAMLVMLANDKTAAPPPPGTDAADWPEAFPHQALLVSALLAYPVFDMALAILRDALAGKPFWRAGSHRLHHRLAAAGMSVGRIAAAASAITLLCGAGVLLILLKPAGLRGLSMWAFLAAAILAFGLLVLAGYLEEFAPSAVRRGRARFLLVENFLEMQKAKLEMAGSAEEVFDIVARTLVEFRVARCVARVSGLVAEGRDGSLPGAPLSYAARAGPDGGSSGDEPPGEGAWDGGGMSGDSRGAGGGARTEAGRAGAPRAVRSGSGPGASGGGRSGFGVFEWVWNRPEGAAVRHLAPIYGGAENSGAGAAGPEKDGRTDGDRDGGEERRIELPGGRARASWRHEFPAGGDEAEADRRERLESFMERALERARDLLAAGRRPGGRQAPSGA